jgi:putative acyl-CoA dehydrogenase
MADTQDVFNQSPPFVDVDLYAADLPLQEAVAANGGTAPPAVLSAFGRHWGSASMFEQARLANEYPPKLKTYDPKGRRLDVVEFHPAYHRFMAESMKAGLHDMTWRADGTRAPAPAEVARAARYYMVAQVENGHMCPITMTRAAVGALATEPALLATLMPKIASHDYDPSFRPWHQKSAITIGMGMTEKQGGTDVRANTTRATPSADGYSITGHKWFMSAPMCDGFLVLAQAQGSNPGGLTCFFMPRFRPDGSVNGLRLQRLKDKLGNKSNASSEVEFVDAYALRVGAEGAGIRTIIEMVQLTRLDCAIASAGLMRMGLAQALNHARHRSVFQKKLADQPLMRAVLADLALTMEGIVALTMRLARAFDRAASDPREAAYARLMTPVVKYWVCKKAPAFIYEAMECLGGNGYVEESILPRLYREAPVNAIWEGSGNVMCLDALRALSREGETAQMVFDELAGGGRDLPGSAEAASRIATSLSGAEAEAHARLGVEQLALLAAAAALRAQAPADIAVSFAQANLSQVRGSNFGSVTFGGADKILARALPA